MNRVTTTTRNLNQSQIDVLKLIYKFRFTTSSLIAKELQLKPGTHPNSKLSILRSQGYIGRNYDKSYKLLGKPASYYLLPKSFPMLKDQLDVPHKTIKNVYNDKTASTQFVDHNLAISNVYAKLRATFGSNIGFFTKTDLNTEQYDYFPQDLPDAFVSVATSASPRAKRRYYFLDVLGEGVPFFLAVRKINRYLEYAEAKIWEKSTDSKITSVLIVCESKTLEKRLRKRIAELLTGAEVAPVFGTTTQELLESSSPEDADVWLKVAETTVRQSLTAIK
jgi:hypothetical protein